MGSNPARGMDVCVRLFYVCAVLYVGSGLAMGEALPAVYKITKLKKRQGRTKGCRAIDEWMNEWSSCLIRPLDVRSIRVTAGRPLRAIDRVPTRYPITATGLSLRVCSCRWRNLLVLYPSFLNPTYGHPPPPIGTRITVRLLSCPQYHDQITSINR
jgi:hypothetical protein